MGCELEYHGHRHALEGFPRSGTTWDTFCEKQRGVLATAEKIDRELKGAVRYNPTTLAGIEYPLGATLDSIATLLGAIEEIKQAAVYAVQELPGKVRDFSRMVQGQFGTGDAASK